MPPKYVHTSIDGRKIRLSNLTNILYPNISATKASLIEYYLDIQHLMLPHVKYRPITMIRYPEGINGERFYVKNLPNWAPSWIIKSGLDAQDDNKYLIVHSIADIVWAANLASLEIHSTQSRLQHLDKYDQLIFDLDPPDSMDFEIVKSMAVKLKEFLESYNYVPFVKTSGSRGLHVYVPILPNYSIDQSMEAAKDLAQKFVNQNPETTLHFSKEKRQGKMLMDIFRNGRAQTCVVPYSTRGKENAPISMPFYWKDINDIAASNQFNISNYGEYLHNGNPWKDFYSVSSPLHLAKQQHRQQHLSKVDQNLGIKEQLKNFEPQLAEMGNENSFSPIYFYEIKWDGIRVMAYKSQNHTRLISRGGRDISANFPLVVEAITNLPVDNVVLDGEIVTIDSKGKPVFAQVISRMHTKGTSSIIKASKANPATFYAFDCLYINGSNICNEPIETRRNLLEKTIENFSNHLKFSQTFDDGKALFEQTKIIKLEGVMAKLRGSTYLSGQRSSNWLKIKVRTELEVFIIGFTLGEGDRKNTFGALHCAELLGDNHFIYRGKIGTGFDQAKINLINEKLSNHTTTSKPDFVNRIDEKESIWIIPTLKARINYASLTKEGILREPVFIELI